MMNVLIINHHNHHHHHNNENHHSDHHDHHLRVSIGTMMGKGGKDWIGKRRGRFTLPENDFNKKNLRLIMVIFLSRNDHQDDFN